MRVMIVSVVCRLKPTIPACDGHRAITYTALCMYVAYASCGKIKKRASLSDGRRSSHEYAVISHCSTILLTLLYGRPAKPMENGSLGCQNSETPEPINIKFGVGAYIGDITPQAKIQDLNGVLPK